MTTKVAVRDLRPGDRLLASHTEVLAVQPVQGNARPVHVRYPNGAESWRYWGASTNVRVERSRR